MAKRKAQMSAQMVRKASGGDAVEKRIVRQVKNEAKDKRGRVRDLLVLRRKLRDASAVSPALLREVLLALVDEAIIEAAE